MGCGCPEGLWGSEARYAREARTVLSEERGPQVGGLAAQPPLDQRTSGRVGCAGARVFHLTPPHPVSLQKPGAPAPLPRDGRGTQPRGSWMSGRPSLAGAASSPSRRQDGRRRVGAEGLRGAPRGHQLAQPESGRPAPAHGQRGRHGPALERGGRPVLRPAARYTLPLAPPLACRPPRLFLPQTPSPESSPQPPRPASDQPGARGWEGCWVG